MEWIVLILVVVVAWAIMAGLSYLGGTVWNAATDVVEALTDLAYDWFGDLGIEDEAWFRVLVMLPVGIALSVVFGLCVAVAYRGSAVIIGAVLIVLLCLGLGVAADPNRRGGGGDDGPKLPLNL